ncbi:D-alanyl-D-alanine carboxypeptidase family protein [Inediibacterium massiliense]|uniref:D-alanyl-D-alanine carboxypeptidase family protein n=1 Tax=Inediibacterium massiliense TaxID=1658111 RepID=UPI0006B41D6D|nr:D-alanyl-D-alanine carboxypeptidase family protein [Inediibacterium massiliense]
MKKRTLLFIFLLICSNLSIGFCQPIEPTITAPSAILLDGDTGDILYEKDSHTPMYPASTTKIMTAILTLENTNLNDKVIIDKDSPYTGGSRIYIIEGEEFTVEQLLHALLIDSANDAAVALAIHISDSVEDFTKLMNKRAQELGAKNTHFTNPNGLPDPDHLTTSYDLAMIAKHAMTIPKFREIVKTVKYDIPPTNKQEETRHLYNSNRLLWGTGRRNQILYQGKYVNIKYDIVEGIKTGYTDIARQCLVTSAKKNNHRLISVVLKAEGKNIYIDSRTLIDYGFDNFKLKKIIDSGEKIQSISIENGTKKSIDVLTKSPLYKVIPKNEKLGSIEQTISLNKNIKAPVEKGQSIGKITYTTDGEILGNITLIASDSVSVEKISSFSWIKIILYFLFFLFIIFLILRTIITINRIQKRKKRLTRRL